ncbi:hypothetical protein GCM10011588_08850 [Nocardia jinanensis]|uniref:Uncharacterized protein n=1 Tax=Nocardia jinanensis TaxID=382504 RepID=A0A917R9B9_9NOCA|nr:hypothetical protein GCM10011588_08850 [Nocardia jinanensis]
MLGVKPGNGIAEGKGVGCHGGRAEMPGGAAVAVRAGTIAAGAADDADLPAVCGAAAETP